jgi:hypothetical protein
MASPARHRYNRSSLILCAFYVPLLIGSTLYFRSAPRDGIAAYIAAVLPALPIVGIFIVLGRYLVDESDEFERLMMVRKVVVATGFMLSVATVWGFLESFGLVARVDSYVAAILWFFGLGLGSIYNRLTLGAPVRC